MATDIKNNPAKYHWAPGEDIVLAVCYGGSGGTNSVAAIFARILGVHVYATPYLTIINPRYELFPGKPTNENVPDGVIPPTVYRKDWQRFPH